MQIKKVLEMESYTRHKVRELYQKQTKEKLVDECVLLYEHVQKLGQEKMIRELSDGLNANKRS